MWTSRDPRQFTLYLLGVCVWRVWSIWGALHQGTPPLRTIRMRETTSLGARFIVHNFGVW
ncbi:hypothetical protein BDV59DRAFT_159622 [Aspergillus ambiguus]|uniref:uncharacterized protein n=1 Tax=Aspergillus ambiguus TaxID=176160 RepID=UPI003CCD9654